MKLSIIIVNWNTCDLIRQCLYSIQTHPPDCEYEVWVVDNASSDDSVFMLQKDFDWVHLIQNPQNLGFSHANNQAILASSGEYIFILNSDTLLLPNTLAHMVKFIENHPQVGLVGTHLINPDGSPQYCFGSQPILINECLTALGMDRWWLFSKWLVKFDKRDRQVIEEYMEVGWVLGAAMLVRRVDLVKVGLLEESYFMYCEELDWARRFLNNGLKVVTLTEPTIIHLGRSSSNKANNRMVPQLYRSKMQFLEKYSGRLAHLVFRLLVACVAAAKTVFYGLAEFIFKGSESEAHIWKEVFLVAITAK